MGKLLRVASCFALATLIGCGELANSTDTQPLGSADGSAGSDSGSAGSDNGSGSDSGSAGSDGSGGLNAAPVAQVQLLDTTDASSTTAVGISDAGNATVFWSRPSAQEIWYAGASPNAAWSTPAQIASRATAPAVAIDRSGNGVAGYVQYSVSDPQTLSNGFLAWPAWATPADNADTLHAGGGNLASLQAPWVALNASGTGETIWMEQETYVPAEVTGLTFYEPWQYGWSGTPSQIPPTTDTTLPNPPSDSAIGLDGTGYTTIAWGDDFPGPFTLAVLTNANDYIWDSTSVFSYPDRMQGIGAIQLAVDTAGDGTLAWAFEDATDTYNVAVVRFTGWVFASRRVEYVIAQAPQFQGQPAIAIDDAGTSTVVWNGSSGLTASRATLTGTWSAPVVLTPDWTSQPRVAADSSGGVVAAWVDGGNVNVARFSNGAWSMRAVLEANGAANGDTLSLAGGASAAVVGWTESDGRVMAATF